MMTASLRASATLALFRPARLAIRIAQLFKAVQPLIGLVRMMWLVCQSLVSTCEHPFAGVLLLSGVGAGAAT
jgi:hypothetical protein